MGSLKNEFSGAVNNQTTEPSPSRERNTLCRSSQVGAKIQATSTTQQLATVSVPAVYIQLTAQENKN